MNAPSNQPPRVLVSAASKHGATAEIAEQIGESLRKRGLDVMVAPPADVKTLDGYDGVILGSAVYAGHWIEEAKELATRIAKQDPKPSVWIFSSGPVGDPPKPEEEPVDVAKITEAVVPQEHRVFAGKIDKSKLGFGERAIMTALRAPAGDFRDWDQITSWAEQIAHQLRSRLDSTSGTSS